MQRAVEADKIWGIIIL